MADSSEVREVLEKMEPGTEVRIRLEDGSEHDAIVGEEEITLADAEGPLDLEQVDEVLADVTLGGPE